MTSQRRTVASRGAGFTLVEVLIVIVIIGLLAGMTTTVVVGARKTVNNSVVSTQMAQLSIALDEYKNRYGEYPPNLSDQSATLRHIAKRWPRFQFSASSTTDALKYAEFLALVRQGCELSSGTFDASGNLTNYPHYWELGECSSLIFWLGGLPNEKGVPSGFFASPKRPFGVDSTGRIARIKRAKREKPLFAFDVKYIRPFTVDANEVYSVVEDFDLSSGAAYAPAFCQGGYPIAYFRPSVAQPYGAKYFYFGDTGTGLASCATPYAKIVNGTTVDWYESDRFQLIHPGADGLFSATANVYVNTIDGVRTLQPKNANVALEDGDNLTNFLERGTLESEYVEK